MLGLRIVNAPRPVGRYGFPRWSTAECALRPARLPSKAKEAGVPFVDINANNTRDDDAMLAAHVA